MSTRGKKQKIELIVRSYSHGRNGESLKRAQLQLDEETREAIEELPEQCRVLILEQLTRIGLAVEGRTLFHEIINALDAHSALRQPPLPWRDQADAFFDRVELSARQQFEDYGFSKVPGRLARLTSRLGLIALGDGSNHSPSWAPETDAVLLQLRQLGFKQSKKSEGRQRAEGLWKFLQPIYSDALVHDACLRVYAERVLQWIERRRYSQKTGGDEPVRKDQPEDTGEAVLCDPKVLEALPLSDTELGAVVRQLILEKGMETLKDLQNDAED